MVYSLSPAVKQMILDAFDQTPHEYRTHSLLQRNPSSKAAGSTFLTPLTWEDLRNADWSPTDDEGIIPPAVGYRSEIPGLLGIAPLSALDPHDRIRLQPAHKGTIRFTQGPEIGEIASECVAILQNEEVRQVSFTTLVLQQDLNRKDQPWVVATFYPGPATFIFPEISIRMIQTHFKTDKVYIDCTVQDALNLGYTYCKHVSRYEEE